MRAGNRIIVNHGHTIGFGTVLAVYRGVVDVLPDYRQDAVEARPGNPFAWSMLFPKELVFPYIDHRHWLWNLTEG